MVVRIDMNKYAFHSKMEIEFENKKIAELFYYSLYPDIKRTASKYFKVELCIEGNKVIFEVYAYSIGKFRGIYKTILRLLNVLNQLYSSSN